MRKLSVFLLAFTALSGFSQVSVEEKKVNVDGTTHDGFYVSIPYGTLKELEKSVKEELKGWDGKVKDGDFIFADDCKLKEMGKNTFDVYAKLEANPAGGAFLSVTIDLGGAYLNSNEHGAQAKVMNTRLHNLGINVAKNAVGEEVKLEEKALKDRQKELEDLLAEQAKLEKEIEDYKNRITENEKAIEVAKSNQETKKGEITAQEEKLKAVEQKKEAIK
ncbi:MAG: hypothetical protein IT222_11605 [Crocinitomix sp.]|nr:hypothetical protein [Crocinitomix sp.]